MATALVLASSSPTRAALLRTAGVAFDIVPARIDEVAVTEALQAEGAPPRDIADRLAEMKAMRVSLRHPAALVIGSDQIVVHEGRLMGKPADLEMARSQLLAMRDSAHQLVSAVVVCEAGRPVWRHVAEARMRMRAFSGAWADDYLRRHQDVALGSAGGYRIEDEGIRLFSAIEGDYFTVLGLPLLPLLSWLTLRGAISS
jgi:septum formation protein